METEGGPSTHHISEPASRSQSTLYQVTEDMVAGTKALLVIRGLRHLLEGQTTRQLNKHLKQSASHN